MFLPAVDVNWIFKLHLCLTWDFRCTLFYLNAHSALRISRNFYSCFPVCAGWSSGFWINNGFEKLCNLEKVEFTVGIPGGKWKLAATDCAIVECFFNCTKNGASWLNAFPSPWCRNGSSKAWTFWDSTASCVDEDDLFGLNFNLHSKSIICSEKIARNISFSWVCKVLTWMFHCNNYRM